MSVPKELHGWDRAWNRFTQLFSGVHNRKPEWLAMTRYLVGVVATNHLTKAKELKPHSIPCPKTRGNREIKKGGALFIPIFNRGYCLDVCYDLAQSSHQEHTGKPYYFIEPIGEVPERIRESEWVQWIPKAVVRDLHWNPKIWLRGLASFWEASRLINNDALVCRGLEAKFGRWRFHLLKVTLVYYWEIGAAQKWLKKHHIEAVITINDVVKPACAFVAAAKLSGIPSAVIQHGTPGPQSAPFLADEGWVWGQSSVDLLVHFGAEFDRLKIVGNMEVAVSAQETASDRGSRPTLLLLSQWRASTGWNEIEFQTFFLTAADAARSASADWTLLIRLHPNEGEEVKAKIKEILGGSGLAVQFVPEGESLFTSISYSHFACTIGSSSIMQAVAQELPCAILLSEHLESRLGKSLLPERVIARSVDDLMKLLNAMDCLTEAEKKQIISDPKNANKNVERALERLLNHTGNSHAAI